MSICRTRFKNQIVTEFLPPKNKKSGKVMIFCGGVPGVPHKDEVMEFWSEQGYWTFFPRYRGCWESGGSFLAKSPERDVLDVIDSLNRQFKDYWSGSYYKLKAKHITIVGSSFGGPAAILASRDKRVNKVVCLSPVVDWQAEDKADPLNDLYEILRDGYGAAYRVTKTNWNKLAKGNFYNPVKHIKKLNPEKILIFHAKDDKVVRIGPVAKFAYRLGCKFVVLGKGGHLSSSMLMTKRYSSMVMKFISKKVK